MAKNNSARRLRDGKEWERTGNLDFSSVAATVEKAITYVFARRLIRSAVLLTQDQLLFVLPLFQNRRSLANSLACRINITLCGFRI